MVNTIDIITFILSFMVLYFVLRFVIKIRGQDAFKKRLNDLMKYKEHILQEEGVEVKAYKGADLDNASWFKRVIYNLQKMGEKQKTDLEKSLHRAGIRSEKAPFVYRILKILSGILCALGSWVVVYSFTDLLPILKISIILASFLLGSYLIDFVLYKLSSRRQERIRRAFPVALDLMVICAEAGLSLPATIQRVARETSQISPDLAFELGLLSIELNVYTDPKRALENFGNRLDSPYFKSVIATLIQSQQYGTPIAQTMRNMIEQFRIDRLVAAEERAAKLPALMTIPMMLLIFPCIYIVSLGPAIIRVLDNLR